jgi:hypothetical protein
MTDFLGLCGWFFQCIKALKNNINSLAKAILYTYIINNISGIPMCEICTEKSCTVEKINDSALDVCIVFCKYVDILADLSSFLT